MTRFTHLSIRCQRCGTTHYGVETKERARKLKSTQCSSCRTIITQLNGN